MEIYNTDTKETVEISYGRDGDSFSDLSSSDPTIRYNKDSDRMEADTATIDWWADYVTRQTAADDLLSAANEELTDELKDQLADEIYVVWNDYENGPEEVSRVVTEFMTEQGFSLVQQRPYAPYFKETQLHA